MLSSPSDEAADRRRILPAAPAASEAGKVAEAACHMVSRFLIALDVH